MILTSALCFLDEIQNVKDFPKVIDSLYIRDEVDMYVTDLMHICFQVKSNYYLRQVCSNRNAPTVF